MSNSESKSNWNMKWIKNNGLKYAQWTYDFDNLNFLGIKDWYPKYLQESKLLYKMGYYFWDIQYVRPNVQRPENRIWLT